MKRSFSALSAALAALLYLQAVALAFALVAVFEAIGLRPPTHKDPLVPYVYIVAALIGFGLSVSVTGRRAARDDQPRREWRHAALWVAIFFQINQIQNFIEEPTYCSLLAIAGSSIVFLLLARLSPRRPLLAAGAIPILAAAAGLVAQSVATRRHESDQHAEEQAEAVADTMVRGDETALRAAIANAGNTDLTQVFQGVVFEPGSTEKDYLPQIETVLRYGNTRCKETVLPLFERDVVVSPSSGQSTAGCRPLAALVAARKGRPLALAAEGQLAADADRDRLTTLMTFEVLLAILQARDEAAARRWGQAAGWLDAEGHFTPDRYGPVFYSQLWRRLEGPGAIDIVVRLSDPDQLLILLAAESDIPSAKEVVARGARAQASSAAGATALTAYLSRGDSLDTDAMIRLLLAAGADPNRPGAPAWPGLADAQGSMNPPMWYLLARARERYVSKEPMEALLEHGADPRVAREFAPLKPEVEEVFRPYLAKK